MGVITEAFPGELAFLENSLECDIIERNIAYEMDKCSSFFEENEDDEVSEGLLTKMINFILSILKKVGEIISNAVRALTDIGKENITAEKYMQSEHGQAEFNRRFAEVKKEIDDFARQCRPMIAMISNITNCDPEKVERTCDTLNVLLEAAPWQKVAGMLITHDSKQKTMKGYTKEFHIGNKVIISQWKGYAKEADEWKNKIEVATQKVKGLKKSGKEKKKLLAALAKASQTQQKFSTKLFGVFGQKAS